MHKPKTVQPLTPSPEQDLQEISMLEDQFMGQDYRNLFSNKNAHNFIEGWVKPNKKTSGNLVSFKSNVLEVVSHSVPSSFPSQNIQKHKRNLSSNQSSRDVPRPMSSRYHIKRSHSKKWEPQIKNKQKLHLSELQFAKNDNTELSFAKYSQIQPLQKPEENKKGRRESVQAVAFPLFHGPENPQRIPGKATAVGRIRRLMKVKLQRKQ